jgi:hypothetical protein
MKFSSILRMTDPLNGKSHKYNLSASKGFIIFLTPKLFKCFIGGCTLKINSQPIAYLLNGSEHIY